MREYVVSVIRVRQASCQGKCAAVITSLMPIAAAVVAHAANAVSRIDQIWRSIH